MFSLSTTILAYIAILDDGNRVELEDKIHVLSMNIDGGYLDQHLKNDHASKTVWGTCPEQIFWFWDQGNNMGKIVTNIDI